VPLGSGAHLCAKISKVEETTPNAQIILNGT
jgi:hypothetical protein